jgi:hypothetical protein
MHARYTHTISELDLPDPKIGRYLFFVLPGENANPNGANVRSRWPHLVAAY